MFTNFIDAAMRRAQYEWLNEEDGYYGHIPDLPGVWATGQTSANCERELCEVLEDWLMLGVQLGHQLPQAFSQPPS